MAWQILQPLPEPGPTSCVEELADWFVMFARDCRLALPAKETA